MKKYGDIENRTVVLKTAEHANTPTVMHTDTLARAFYTIQQDCQTTFISSYENLDIQGNRMSVVDGRGLESRATSTTFIQ